MEYVCPPFLLAKMPIMRQVDKKKLFLFYLTKKIKKHLIDQQK